jgi:hypothetical protein
MQAACDPAARRLAERRRGVPTDTLAADALVAGAGLLMSALRVRVRSHPAVGECVVLQQKPEPLYRGCWGLRARAAPHTRAFFFESNLSGASSPP